MGAEVEGVGLGATSALRGPLSSRRGRAIRRVRRCPA